MCTASWWEETMLALPKEFQAIAHDQRGHGFSDSNVVVDATRGAADMAEDAFALLDALNIKQVHVVGHSTGGFIVWQMLRSCPERILSGTVVDPLSPFGVGGTTTAEGTLTDLEASGTGSIVISKDLFRQMDEGVREDKGPFSPRGFLVNFLMHPPFRYHREEVLVSSMFLTHHTGDAAPGDTTTTKTEPFIGPGKVGVINSTSPLYIKDGRLATDAGTVKPSLLWIRGEHDPLISDKGIMVATQPMLAQTRHVLDQYKALGGGYEEIVMKNVGHSPFLEDPATFNTHLHAFLHKNQK